MLRVLLILMAIVGLIALIRGFVGRRVGTGPHCRCGYDLEGLAERTTCPECGAAVWDPVNVRLGARRRGPRMMIVGALLLVLGGAGFGTLRALVPPGANPYAWQPDWLLVMQGPGESDGGRLFTDEVISRLQNGGFSPSQRTALARRARAHVQRRDTDSTEALSQRVVGWGRIHVALWAKGELTDEELLDTLERTIVCEVGASGYTISMGSGVNRRSESHPTLVFNLSGVMQDGHGGWVGGDYIRHALVDDRLAFTHGGMAGSARIGFMLQFSLERAYFEGSEPHEILVSRSISTTTPEGFQTDKCWVIMLEVPQLNAAGLPSGQVRLRHEIRSDDPVRSAVSAWRAEQDRANMARMTGQQRETPAPAPSSP